MTLVVDVDVVKVCIMHNALCTCMCEVVFCGCMKFQEFKQVFPSCCTCMNCTRRDFLYRPGTQIYYILQINFYVYRRRHMWGSWHVCIKATMFPYMFRMYILTGRVIIIVVIQNNITVQNTKFSHEVCDARIWRHTYIVL